MSDQPLELNDGGRTNLITPLTVSGTFCLLIESESEICKMRTPFWDLIVFDMQMKCGETFYFSLKKVRKRFPHDLSKFFFSFLKMNIFI